MNNNNNNNISGLQFHHGLPAEVELSLISDLWSFHGLLPRAAPCYEQPFPLEKPYYFQQDVSVITLFIANQRNSMGITSGLTQCIIHLNYNFLIVGTATGYLSMHELHGLLGREGGVPWRALHTALLHLKPDPKAICHTLSPLLILPLASL